MSIVGADMDGENDHFHGGHAASLPSPTLTSESTVSDPGLQADLEDERQMALPLMYCNVLCFKYLVVRRNRMESCIHCRSGADIQRRCYV